LAFIWLEQPQRSEHGKKGNTALVTTRDARERCARSQAGRFHLEGSEADCRFAQAFRRAQHAQEGRSGPIGTFHADLLHQPRGQEFAGNPPQSADAGEGRVAQSGPFFHIFDQDQRSIWVAQSADRL